jgi:ketosteroid isomerase-like protein
MSLPVCYLLLVIGMYTSALPQDDKKATVPTTNQRETILSADATELTRLAGEAGRAYARRDLSVLEGLTADDYVQTDVRGGVLNRAQWLDFVKNRKSDLSVETDSVQVSFYGSAAVVRGRWTYTLRTDGKEVTSYSAWTSVWTRNPDGWKRHVFQNTYINSNADRCAIEAH